MNKNSISVSLGFPGLLTILTIIFVCLKVFGVVSWSWWIVLLPAFIGIGLTILVLAFVLFIIMIVLIVAALGELQ